MPRAGMVAVLALVLAAAACGDDDAGGEQETLTEERYAELMRAHTDTLVEELESWAKADFATQAEAGEALMRLTPVSEHSQQRVRALLAEHGVSGEEVAAFMTEHPEAVDRATTEMQKRFEEAIERVKPSFERLETLPRGDMDAMAERWRRSIAAHAPPPRQAGDALTGWTAIESRTELMAAARAGATADERVIVHVRANWAMPTVKLEREVFADERVATKLAGYRRLFVDVSEDREEHDELTALLDAETLPSVQVWTDAEALAAGISSGTLPPPDVRIEHLVAPDALAGMLP